MNLVRLVLPSHTSVAALLWRLALLAALLLSSTAVASAQPGPPPVTMDIRVGFDGNGRYRLNHWFPTEIIVANDGPDLRGTLEWQFMGMDEPSFRYALDLPRGARKALQLPIIATNTMRRATVTLVVDGRKLFSSNAQLQPVPGDVVLVGVLSSDQSLLNSLRAAQFAPRIGSVVVPLDQSMFPDQARLLAGLDLIFIHELPLGELSPGQRDALESWVAMGGRLIVGGGQAGSLAAANLAHLLPVEVGPLRANVDLAPLEQLVDPEHPQLAAGTATANSVTLRPSGRSLDRAQLVTVKDHGAGQVFFAAFDLSETRTWGNEVQFWNDSSVLSLEPRVEVAPAFRFRGENLMREVLNLPALRLPSTWLMLGLMATYIIVVGPLNFFILRRMRRLEWAWFTTPALVALFLVAAYSSSLLLRGNQPQITQLAIVQGAQGSNLGQQTSFLSIYSPQRRSYQIDFAANTLLTPNSFESWRATDITVHSDDLSVGFEELLVDVSSLRNLLLEQPVTTLPQVAAELEVRPDRLVGELRLESSVVLHNALLVTGEHAQLLGDLASGDSVALDLALNSFNFPHQLSRASSGPIQRHQVLSNIFGQDRFAVGGPQFGASRRGMPDGGIYLMGWSSEGGAALRLDGRDVVPDGETLYIIRLRDGL
ncbi:MAG: hypothetical protein EI684_11635 [Candidatus Viridilinea halotolerans]|uniref:DUF4350 domain-containing protein n=1 Tax=Candidatus Viridilinea halotolerans TaxID=2491704 RepID=A0A426TYY6_9CHLR|nr:MAG: hypothetical protein EI684_11635 [Candidatus Viridilinea halotolerans]